MKRLEIMWLNLMFLILLQTERLSPRAGPSDTHMGGIREEDDGSERQVSAGPCEFLEWVWVL